MADPIPSVHANVFSAHGNGFDVALDFSYRAKPSEEEPPVLTRVTMSWEHLKVMASILTDLVEKYEEQVGPIPRVDQAAARFGGDVS